ncbi:SAF domain-containing protein [Nocardioides terrisoli]|uniref:SAF domain-containing protein n=1 Tax=Nocardioides terrisoli TaxID=3388267 RepID=UPI00287BAAFE|nr:SAF domain-containing protein [Nocardioides marmorisolisilvae]
MTTSKHTAPPTGLTAPVDGERVGLGGRGHDLPRVPRRYGQWAGTVMVVVLAALLAGWLWQQKSDRVEVWQVRTAVPAGSVLQRSDLRTVEVAGVKDAVAVGDVGRLVGHTTAVGLVPGELLTPEMVTDQPVPGPSQRVVGVAVDASRSPAGMSPGDVVEVLAVPPSGDASNPQTLQNPAVLAGSATVRSMTRLESGGSRLTLVVSRAEADRVAAFAAAGRVAVVQAPLGGDR